MATALAPDGLDTSEVYDVRLRQRGQITVPREVRDRLNVNEGDTLALVQVGSTLILTPKRPVESPIEHLGEGTMQTESM